MRPPLPVIRICAIPGCTETFTVTTSRARKYCDRHIMERRMTLAERALAARNQRKTRGAAQ